MSTVLYWTEEANKAIEEINPGNITVTNQLMYATAAVTHCELSPGKNTKKIEWNTLPWRIRIEKYKN